MGDLCPCDEPKLLTLALLNIRSLSLSLSPNTQSPGNHGNLLALDELPILLCKISNDQLATKVRGQHCGSGSFSQTIRVRCWLSLIYSFKMEKLMPTYLTLQINVIALGPVLFKLEDIFMK